MNKSWRIWELLSHRWTVLGAGIILTLLIAWGNSTKRGISTEAWRNSYPDARRARLPGRQMQCVGGKLDPICVGSRFSIAHAKYGVPVRWENLKKGPHDSALDGIVG